MKGIEEIIEDVVRRVVREELSRMLGRPVPSVQSETMSAKQTASAIGVAAITLAQWRQRGEGPPHFKVGRNIRYRPHEVDAWLAKRRRG